MYGYKEYRCVFVYLHLQHTMQGAAKSNSGLATRRSRPKPAKIPTTCKQNILSQYKPYKYIGHIEETLSPYLS